MADTQRDTWWHCTWCGNNERAEEPYDVGDKEPCAECGEGTAIVMTIAQAAKYESEIARGVRTRERSYSDG